MGGTSGYLRQISTGNTFSLIYMSGTTSSTGINVLSLNNDRYYRRIAAIDKARNTGLWTAGQSFVIDTLGPNLVFTGSNPAT